jgi:dihydroorotate dehydrogenase
MANSSVIIGDQTFAHPVINASGCWCKTYEQMRGIYLNPQFSGIVSKTCDIERFDGNPEPNLHIGYVNNDEKFGQIEYILNCMGLPNNGFDYYSEHFKKFTNKPYILSLNGNNLENLLKMLTKYNDIIAEDYSIRNNNNCSQLVEINLSCPNIVDKNEIIGYHPDYIINLCKRIADLHLVFVDIGFKLPPYLEKAQLQKIAAIIQYYCISANIKFIVCCNTIPNGMVLDSVSGNPILSAQFGGISSSAANKLIGISNVFQFSQYFNINSALNSEKVKIIGCGGIKTCGDVDDYLHAGASLVQIGSALLIKN